MTTKLILSAFFVAALAGGCATDDENSERGPLGKADAFGSCAESSCDGQAIDGNCWCDDDCATYGDCCEDKVDVCEPAQILCGGFAGLQCPDGYSCTENTEDSCDPANGGRDCAGVCVANESCGGRLGLTCGEGEFCSYDVADQCGAADHLGTCAPQPEACIQLYDPVCGCDGQTYSNGCHANAAGTSVLHEGECQAPADSCGGFAGLTCDDGEFCSYDEDAQCGAADQLGTCAPSPDFCYELYAPVCGCDGQTYSNDCYANAAGTSVLHQGPCEDVQPQQCGGFAGQLCGAGEFCSYDAEAQCGATDHLGTCASQPDACLDVYDPVCGCDGQTYSNGCYANGAGTSVLHEGACGSDI